MQNARQNRILAKVVRRLFFVRRILCFTRSKSKQKLQVVKWKSLRHRRNYKKWGLIYKRRLKRLPVHGQSYEIKYFPLKFQEKVWLQRTKTLQFLIISFTNSPLAFRIVKVESFVMIFEWQQIAILWFARRTWRLLSAQGDETSIKCANISNLSYLLMRVFSVSR